MSLAQEKLYVLYNLLNNLFGGLVSCGMYIFD